ncbi:hypothetical protein Tco_0833071 [Tanacetum coccineum]
MIKRMNKAKCTTVGIKSFLNAASITAALIDVNAAQSVSTYLSLGNPFSAKTSPNWYQVIVEFGVGVGFILDFHKKGVRAKASWKTEDVTEGGSEITDLEVYNFTGAGGVALSMYNIDELWVEGDLRIDLIDFIGAAINIVLYDSPLSAMVRLEEHEDASKGRDVFNVSWNHDPTKDHDRFRLFLLGLDVGDKYVGLAVSDFNNKVASHLRYSTI